MENRQFHIIDAFELSERSSLVLAGEVNGGETIEENIVLINYNGQDYQYKISGVECIDKSITDKIILTGICLEASIIDEEVKNKLISGVITEVELLNE